MVVQFVVAAIEETVGAIVVEQRGNEYSLNAIVPDAGKQAFNGTGYFYISKTWFSKMKSVKGVMT